MPEPGAPVLICQLRVAVRGISPLIWRRLLVPADTTIAGLHEVLQLAFGWSGAYLHCFKVHGREYGLCYDGGPVFRDDARQVRLVSLGLREGERFSYEYNFVAAWHLDLRLEQISGPGRGGPIRGVRAGGAPARRRNGTGPGLIWSGPGHAWRLRRSPARRRSRVACFSRPAMKTWPASAWIARS